jgi:arylsulfatase A-like enzyme
MHVVLRAGLALAWLSYASIPSSSRHLQHTEGVQGHARIQSSAGAGSASWTVGGELTPAQYPPVPFHTPILLVILDDIGLDSVACHPLAQVPAPTPELTALAAEGRQFLDAWGAPVCSPSRALIQTGEYQAVTDVGTGLRSGRLDPSFTTIPEALHASNAAIPCGYFGKWHLSMEPQDPHDVYDYDHFSGTMGNLDTPAENYFQWTRHTVGDEVPYFSELVTTYSTTAIVDDALSWISTLPPTEPWFCVVALHAAHIPFHAPPQDLHSFSLPNAAPRQGEDPRAYYLAMVEAADREVGRLVANVPPSTVVILCADNGTPPSVIEDPFDRTHAKSTLFQGGIRVPFIIRSPTLEGTVHQGQPITGPVTVADIYSTVLEIFGAAVPRAIYSRSLWSVLHEDEFLLSRPFTAAEKFHPNGPGPYALRNIAVSDGTYKLIHRRMQSDLVQEFYDVVLDVDEQSPIDLRNLTPEQQAVFDAMLNEVALLEAM